MRDEKGAQGAEKRSEALGQWAGTSALARLDICKEKNQYIWIISFLLMVKTPLAPGGGRSYRSD